MWEKRFKKNTQRFKDKKIVLFGITEICMEFLQQLHEYNIIGVMDSECQESIVNGFKRLTYEEAASLGTEIIVLTKQLIGDGSTFSELCDFCKEQDILLSDIYGNNICSLIENASKAKVDGRVLTERILLEKIDRYDVISFDIFDTLLMRRTLIPEDVFTIVEEKALAEGIELPDFKNIRIKAQLDNGLINPDIYEVYDSLQKLTHITDGQKNRLLTLETNTEKEVLIPRDKMVYILKEAIKRGKRVVLVSDMYIPGSILKSILTNNGIEGYESLYVSCDCKMLKLEGLFEKLIGNREEKVLHIGDSLINDGICAEMLGLDYCLIPSALELLRITKWEKCEKELKGINDRSLLGMCISRIFNDPFVLAGNRNNLLCKNVEDFGYVVLGAIVASFLVWMLDKLKNSEIEKILFASRDGFIVKKLYDYVMKSRRTELPESQYFYISRKVAMTSDMSNEAIIKLLIDVSKDLAPDEMMRNVFGLEKEDVLPCTAEDYVSPDLYAWKHAEKICRKSKAIRKNYYRYMGSEGLKIGAKYAFVDFVSSGTCQKSLLRYAPFELCGLYFAWNSNEDERLYDIEAFYSKDDVYFFSNYKLIEIFMTSEESSLADFDESGRPIFAEELRTREEIDIIKKVHKDILNFGQVYFDCLYVTSEAVNHKLSNTIFGCVNSFDEKESIFSDFQLFDDWRNKKVSRKEWSAVNRIDSQEEFVNYYRSTAPEHLVYERELAQKCNTEIDKRYKLQGFCGVCGQRREFQLDFQFSDNITPNFRESLICPECSLNNRQRYVVSKVLKELEDVIEKKVYLYEKETLTYDKLREILGEENVIGGRYISGDLNLIDEAEKDKIVYENPERMGFEDDAFGLLVSNDVFGYVDNYKKSFSEAARVLYKGGKLCLSVAFDPSRRETSRRIGASEGEVLWTYGWDMLDILHQAGFRDAYMEPYYSIEFGYLGEGIQFLFVAIK